MSPPYRLYKYEPFNAQSLKNLKDQVIYFGSPLRFNDPYDCALYPSIQEPSNEEIAKFRRYYLEKKGIPDEVRRHFELAPIQELRDLILRTGRQILDQAISDFLAQRGVSCFSERVDSLLMWSHYAEQCKGFCLEFDTTTEPFQKLRKVRYQQSMPVINVIQILCEEADSVIDLYCTKAIDWAYEHEWRGIHNQANTAFVYPANALTGVYLGPDMPFTALEILALILAGQNENVQLWKGARSKTSFSVEFQPTTYTSYLEAKRLELLQSANSQ